MARSPISIVESALQRFAQLRLAYAHLFPPAGSLYPIPFFGDIRRAQVLTLALNPSHGEFARNRSWENQHDAQQLTTRLLHYFDLPVTPPHKWFEPLEKGLLYLGCSYETNAAHLDLCPHPTLMPWQIAEEQRLALHEFLRAQAQHLVGILSLCFHVKLVVVINYAGVFQTIQQALPILGQHIVDAGDRPPILLLDYNGCSESMFRQRHRLREFLSTARVLPFLNHA